MQLKSKLTTACAVATATVFAVGYAVSTPHPDFKTSDRAENSSLGSQPAAAAVALPGAFVLAKKPTITEILDLVLGDRQPDVAVASEREEARIAAMLRARTPDTMRANRIAAALVREGRRSSIGSTLLVGVLLTENPDLEPRATSRVGARGLMQVMPMHAGKWGCASSDLFDIEANICHGVRILADNLQHSRTLPAALLRYNGCVHGANTPDCYLYASAVYRQARRSASPDGRITAATPFAAPSLSRSASKSRSVKRGAS